MLSLRGIARVNEAELWLGCLGLTYRWWAAVKTVSAWASRRPGGVPEEITTFCPKPQLALGLLTELVADGLLPACWVVCNKVCGRPTFWTE